MGTENMGSTSLACSWWEQLRVCEASDEWPGYTQSVVDFDIDAMDMGLDEADDDE
jgi:hypothetical protein